jgi:hypothetical protein
MVFSSAANKQNGMLCWAPNGELAGSARLACGPLASASFFLFHFLSYFFLFSVIYLAHSN